MVFLPFLCKRRNIKDLQTTQVVAQEEREREQGRQTLPSSFPLFCAAGLWTQPPLKRRERGEKNRSYLLEGRGEVPGV